MFRGYIRSGAFIPAFHTGTEFVKSKIEQLVQAFKMQSSIEGAELVVTKQTVCSAKIDLALQRIIREVEVAKDRLDSVNEVIEPENILSSLGKSIQDDLKTIVGHTKDIHSAIGKLGKVCLF